MFVLLELNWNYSDRPLLRKGRPEINWLVCVKSTFAPAREARPGVRLLATAFWANGRRAIVEAINGQDLEWTNGPPEEVANLRSISLQSKEGGLNNYVRAMISLLKWRVCSVKLKGCGTVFWLAVALWAESLALTPSERNAELARAHQLESLASYDEAVEIYRRLLTAVVAAPEGDGAWEEQVNLLLARALYASERDEELVRSVDPLNRDVATYVALAHLRLREPDQAYELLKDHTAEQLSDEGQWCLAQAAHQLGRHDQAVELWQCLRERAADLKLRQTALVALARAACEAGQEQSAVKALQDLEMLQPLPKGLQRESAYLLGELQFKRGDFIQAIAQFEQASSEVGADSLAWYLSCRQRLATCHLARAEEADCSAEERQQRLQTSLTYWKDIDAAKGAPRDDSVLLGLGRCTLLLDPAALAEVEQLWTGPAGLRQHEARLEALGRLAKAAPTYAQRESYLRRLIDEAVGHSAWTLQAWYERGLSDLQEAHEQAARGKAERAQQLRSAAGYAFFRCFELSLAQDPSFAAQAAKLHLDTLLAAVPGQVPVEAVEYLERLVAEYPEVIEASSHPAEFLYLKGWAAMAQPDWQQRGPAIETDLRQAWQRYPQGPFADKALFLLATYCYRGANYLEAATLFARLQELYPHSDQVAEALYWQARCCQALEPTGERHRQLMQRLYDTYPHSRYAAEAYFHAMPAELYQRGEASALSHLKELPNRFPHSPYSLQALLLLGLNARQTQDPNLLQALDLFCQVETRFEQLYRQAQLSAQELPCAIAMRYRALLERAQVHEAIARRAEGTKRYIHLECAVEQFERLCAELEVPNHPLASLLVRDETLHPLLEEASYGLAKVYSVLGDDVQASLTLDHMLRRHQAAKVSRGYYLSRAHFQKALLARKMDRPDQALQELQLAEEAAKGQVLAADERLELWLQRSDCYRQQGQLDRSMVELSRIVNDDSVSSLRLQAMYQRAELYELQNRPELAQRQLEATARKGGAWGRRAEQKLKRDYHDK